MKSRIIIGMLLLIAGLQSFCQDTIHQVLQPHRYEKEVKYNDDDFVVISLYEEGLALLRDKNKYKGGTRTWEMIFLDTELQEKQTLDLEVDQKKSLLGYEFSENFLYLLFKTPETHKTAFDLVSVQIRSFDIKVHEIKPELTIQLSHLIKVGTNAILGGYVNNEPAILLYNMASDNLKVLPGFFQKETELIDLRANQNQTFNIVLIDRTDRANQKLIFKTFDSNGVELINDLIHVNEDYYLHSGISSSLIREDLSVIGSWGTRNSKQSNGFYYTPINPFDNQKIKFIAFGELNHYLDHLGPKRAKKIKDRTANSLSLQQIPVFTNYVKPHKIVENKNGFIVHAEAYTPSSNLARYPNQYPYGYSTYPSAFYYGGNYPLFYRYDNDYYNQNVPRENNEVNVSHSVLVAFDGQGERLWDFSMNLDDMRTIGLEQVTDFCVYDDKVYLVYINESKLIVKTITLDSEEEVETTEPIKLSILTEVVRSEDKNYGGIRFWYHNNFYVWGKQTIRDNSKRDEGTRQVFYVNKVVAH